MLIKPESLDSFETGVLDTASQAAERRLYRHLLTYWQRQRRGRSFPALADIRPQDIGDLWSSCFILDPVSDPHFPCFHYLGPALAKYVGILLSGSSDWTEAAERFQVEVWGEGIAPDVCSRCQVGINGAE